MSFCNPVRSYNEREGRGLHAADRQAPVVGQGVGAAGVHADEPVGLCADVGRGGEPVVVGFGAHGFERLADRVGFQARRPQSHHGLAGVRVAGDAAEDRLALTVRVARVDEQVHARVADEPGDGPVLFGGAFGPADRPLPVGIGVDGQVVHAPLAPRMVLVFAGFRELHEMPLRPGDDRVRQRHAPVPVFDVAADGVGDGLADASLFRDDEPHHCSFPSPRTARSRPSRSIVRSQRGPRGGQAAVMTGPRSDDCRTGA